MMKTTFIRLCLILPLQWVLSSCSSFLILALLIDNGRHDYPQTTWISNVLMRIKKSLEWEKKSADKQFITICHQICCFVSFRLSKNYEYFMNFYHKYFLSDCELVNNTGESSFLSIGSKICGAKNENQGWIDNVINCYDLITYPSISDS